MKTTEKKIIHIYTLMQKLYEGMDIYPQSEYLLNELEVNERTLRRYINDIHTLYGHILVTEKKQKLINGKKITIFRVADRQTDMSKILRFFLEETSELGWILSLIHENNPSLIKQLNQSDKTVIEKNIAHDKDIFLFKSNPFENLQDKHEMSFFLQLKSAVKNHEYRTITYRYDATEVYENAKCLKLIFVNNNWYIAIETEQDTLRLLRIAFITHMTYASKSTYQTHVLAKYTHYFETMQNAMSLQGVALQTAIIKASPHVRRYFKNGMKPFFSSQKFIKEEEDGSILFSIHYTQSIEILPFIKQWLPDLEILEPLTLKQTLKNQLQKALIAL